MHEKETYRASLERNSTDNLHAEIAWITQAITQGKTRIGTFTGYPSDPYTRLEIVTAVLKEREGNDVHIGN